MTKKKQHSDKSSNPIVWIAGLVLACGLAVVAGLYWNQSVTVHNVSFSGYHFVELEDIEQAAQVPTGIHPDSIDFRSIIQRIETIDYVKSVHIDVEPGGDLAFEITERQPIALLMKGSSKMYVDADGVALPIILEKSQDVPLVYGFNASQKDTLSSTSFSQIRDFLVEAQQKPLGWTTISEVIFTKEEGVTALSHENGVKLLFGYNDFSDKLANWETFYAEVIREKGIERMRQVDLRFKNQVVTKEI